MGGMSVGYVITFILGTFTGVALMALMQVAKDD